MSKYFKQYADFFPRLLELYKKCGKSKTRASRELYKEVKDTKGITESSLISWGRKELLRWEKGQSKFEIDELEEKEAKEETRNEGKSKETFMPSAWDEKQNKFLSLDEYCDKYNLPKELAVGARLVSHQAGHMVYNIGFKNFAPGEEDFNIQEIINDAVKKYSSPCKKAFSGLVKRSHDFTRVVYSDVHIGMNPNPDGRSLYGGVWDRGEIMLRVNQFAAEILQSSKSETLYVDELGDFLDGYDAETVRKGHKLPQNLNNREQFDVGVAFKVSLADMLHNHFKKIVFNNVCEDNHAGDIGYIVNEAAKLIIEEKYENIEVINHEKFINHYFVGEHAFIICHGKDSKNLKFGFKPFLESKQVEKIDQYLKENDVYKHANFIEFSKGDSHQMLLDYCTSDDFSYFNYPAFSPSSNWIQTNFKKGRSGFVIQNIFNDKNEKEIIPFFFNWNK